MGLMFSCVLRSSKWYKSLSCVYSWWRQGDLSVEVRKFQESSVCSWQRARMWSPCSIIAHKCVCVCVCLSVCLSIHSIRPSIYPSSTQQKPCWVPCQGHGRLCVDTMSQNMSVSLTYGIRPTYGNKRHFRFYHNMCCHIITWYQE